MLALAAFLALQAPDACDAEGARPLAKELPEARGLAGVDALLPGALVKRGASALVVDERVEQLTIFLRDPGAERTAALALPRSARGSLGVRFGAVDKDPPACVGGRAVWAEDELVRLEIVTPARAALRVKRAGGARDVAWTLEAITAYPAHVDVTTSTGEAHPLYLGDGLPAAELLVREGGGGRRFLASLAALDDGLDDDVRAATDAASRGVAFLATAEQLRAALPTTLPEERLAIARAIDVDRLPAALRSLARYWKGVLSPSTAPGEGRARILVDDDVTQVFIEGVSVFNRAAGTSTNVDIPAPRAGVRVWVVGGVEPGAAGPRVFDTRAVVVPGALYTVGVQRFAPVSGGARRECIRVRGTVATGRAGAEPLRWRELGSPPGPLMGPDEAFRPSGAQDRREIGVVDRSLSAARVPPLPLVHSYTHPGTYEWTLSVEGTVSLRLIPDVKLCDDDDTDTAAP